MTSCSKKQSGQAAFEYILLLIIVMVLGMGLGYQFNTSAQQLVAGFFGKGGYLECLVENSELPFSSESCTVPKWRSYKTQKPKIEDTIGSGTLNGGTGANASAGGGSKSSDGKTGKERSVPTNSADRRNGSFNGFQSNPNSQKSGGADSKVGKKDDAYTGSDKISSVAVSGGAGNSDSDKSGGSLRPRYVESSGASLGDSIAKRDNNIPTTSRDLKTKAELIQMGEAKRKAASMEDPSFTLGNFFKYILLGVMLIAVIFFVGSQLYAISKGAKGEQ